MSESLAFDVLFSKPSLCLVTVAFETSRLVYHLLPVEVFSIDDSTAVGSFSTHDQSLETGLQFVRFC